MEGRRRRFLPAAAWLCAAALPQPASAQQACTACLSRCSHQLFACQNSNLSTLSCRHASFSCAAACNRSACAPGASLTPGPSPPRIPVPNVR